MCRHRWKEVRRAYTPGQSATKLSASSGSEEFALRLVEGVTTVELRCRVCGDIRERTLAGKVLGPELNDGAGDGA